MSDHPLAAEADIVKHATELPAAIPADLTVFGGILRCETCRGDRPLDDLAGYVSHGWPKHCGRSMTWVTLRALAFESREVPEGCELVAVPDEAWRIDAGSLCARMTKGRRSCRKPSVAAFNRQHVRSYGYGEPSRVVDSWWPRCLGHMGGNWIEDGQVWHWVLREAES